MMNSSNSQEEHGLRKNPCPMHLLTSLLSTDYLIALQKVEPTLFVEEYKWVEKYSETWWNHLNTRITNYLNRKFSSQGLNIGETDKEMNMLINTILEDICSKGCGDSNQQAHLQKSNSELLSQYDSKELLKNLQHVLNVMAKKVRVMTGKYVIIAVEEDR